MTPSLIVVALGAVAAAVATGVLTARCTKAPRIFLVAWTVALFWLAIALASQALGDLAGYSGPIFRAMELGLQAIGPLLVCLGMVELAARSLPGKFAMRLAVTALGVIAVVILGSDPLDPNATFSKAWPDPAVFYEPVPKLMVEFLAVFTLLAAVGGGATILLRKWRSGRQLDVAQPVLLGAGAAAMLALPGLFTAGHINVPMKDVFAVVGAAAAGLIWFACSSAEHRGLTEPPVDRYRSPDSEDALDRSVRRYAGNDLARNDGFKPGPDAGVSYPGLAALAAEPPAHGDRHRPDDGFDDSGMIDDSGLYDSRAGSDDSGQYDAARRFDDSGQYDGRYDDSGVWDDGAARSDPRGSLFGQITIYTLLDDRVADFDRLTERVVDEVRASEPGTLAYIVHAVPTAPLQRILYEVYQDRGAYDEHQARPYVASYEAERRRHVLATNVIELGLQQAKVSPFPTFSAISDLLSESGIDLTGVTKSSRRRAADDADGYSRDDRYASDGRFGPDGSYARDNGRGADDHYGPSDDYDHAEDYGRPAGPGRTDGYRRPDDHRQPDDYGRAGQTNSYSQAGGFMPAGGHPPEAGFGGDDGYTVPADGRGPADGRSPSGRYALDVGHGPDGGRGLDDGYGPDGGRGLDDGYGPDGGRGPDDGYGPDGGRGRPDAGYTAGRTRPIDRGYGPGAGQLPDDASLGQAGGGYGPQDGYRPQGGHGSQGGHGPEAGYGPNDGYGADRQHGPAGSYDPGAGYGPGGRYPPAGPNDQSVPGSASRSGRDWSGQDDELPEEPGYQGWAGLRGDDGYR